MEESKNVVAEEIGLEEGEEESALEARNRPRSGEGEEV